MSLEQLENGTNRDRVITIKAVYKTGTHTIEPAFDEKLGWWAGVERLSEDEKKSRDYYITVGEKGEKSRNNTRIKLKDGVQFDLLNEIDYINWQWVRECKHIVADSFEAAQASTTALFYVYEEGREAEQSNRRSEREFEAVKCVMEDATTNYEDRALLLGLDMYGEKPAIVKEYLIEQAKKNPDAVLRIYKGNTMKLHLLYLKAKKAGLISQGADKVIKYREHILGISDDAAVLYLQTNREILDLVDRELNPNKPEVTNINEVTTGEKELTPIEKARLAKK